MPKFRSLAVSAGLAANALFLAAPAFSQSIRAPDTLVTYLPPDQRLSLGGILSHAKPLILLIVAALVVTIAYAAFVYIRGVIARRDDHIGGLVFLSALAAGGPMIGFFGAAYDLLDICIGIANKRPSATLIMLAPGFAEAGLCACLGLLAGAIAVIGHRHLTGKILARDRVELAPPMHRVIGIS